MSYLSRENEQDVASQEKYAAQLNGQDAILFDLLLNTLEDERIELLIGQQWPKLIPYLERRWKRLVETQGKPALRNGELDTYGRAQVLLVARLDYLHRMLGERNWYKDRDWQRMAPDLKHILAEIRKTKRRGLRTDKPSTVPFLAFEIVLAAKRRSRSES